MTKKKGAAKTDERIDALTAPLEPVSIELPKEKLKPPPRSTAVNVLISYTPRAGATFLLDLLGMNGGVGIANLANSSLFFGYGDSLANLDDKGVAEWFRERHDKHPIITLKTDWGYLDHLEQHTGLVNTVILSYFDVFIHVQREDVVAQAVSWYVATKTGQFNSLDVPKVHYGDVTYNREEIASRVAQIERDHQRWLHWYKSHNITPHIVTYEALVAEPEVTLTAVYDYLGIEAPDEISEGLLQKLPGRPAWIERYNQGE